MNKQLLRVCAYFIGAFIAESSIPATAQSFILFDVPGAYRTNVLSINFEGAVTGDYRNSSEGPDYGFVRTPEGTFTTFGPQGSISTQPTSINLFKAVAGSYYDSNGQSHGFVRAPGGTITTFDVLVSNEHTVTVPQSIDLSGTITGWYLVYNEINGYHGFVRAPDGTITTFDCPDSANTFPLSINEFGAITGYFVDLSSNGHGFVRAPDGTITTFDVPGPTYDINAVSINLFGVITGSYASYADVNHIYHGYVRAPDGTITTFDAPGAVYYTDPSSIDPEGVITGAYKDGNNVVHGFVRMPDGTIRTLDVPGTALTDPTGINALGTIAGIYQNSNQVSHGFIFFEHRAEKAFPP